MLQEIMAGQKAAFSASAHTELRGQLNRSRRVSMLAGSIVSNSRTDVSGVSARNDADLEEDARLAMLAH